MARQRLTGEVARDCDERNDRLRRDVLAERHSVDLLGASHDPPIRCECDRVVAEVLGADLLEHAGDEDRVEGSGERSDRLDLGSLGERLAHLHDRLGPEDEVERRIEALARREMRLERQRGAHRQGGLAPLPSTLNDPDPQRPQIQAPGDRRGRGERRRDERERCEAASGGAGGGQEHERRADHRDEREHEQRPAEHGGRGERAADLAERELGDSEPAEGPAELGRLGEDERRWQPEQEPAGSDRQRREREDRGFEQHGENVSGQRERPRPHEPGSVEGEARERTNREPAPPAGRAKRCGERRDAEQGERPPADRRQRREQQQPGDRGQPQPRHQGQRAVAARVAPQARLRAGHRPDCNEPGSRRGAALWPFGGRGRRGQPRRHDRRRHAGHNPDEAVISQFPI